jgi:hypothetical protein
VGSQTVAARLIVALGLVRRRQGWVWSKNWQALVLQTSRRARL